MFLLGRISARKQSGTRSKNLGRLAPDVRQKWHTDTISEIDVVKTQDTYLTMQLLTSETFQQNAWPALSDTMDCLV